MKSRKQENTGQGMLVDQACTIMSGKMFMGEVKGRQSPVTKPELQRLIREKGIGEVDSKGGFTQPAVAYRDRHQPDVRQICRRREI